MTRRIFCKVLLVVVAIFGVLVLSSVLSAQGRSDWAFEHVKDVQERNTDRLMAMEGVEGTAIGLNENAQLAIKVFTAGPGVRGIPQQLDGVPVQVVVTGKIYALVDPTAKFPRPVPIGVSTGHPDITAGTIGCRVTDAQGNVYALSNNHVYADENQASIGDAVIQPGAYDGGTASTDTIGTLFDFEPIVFHPRANNTIDAAIAITRVDQVGNATPSDEYGIPSSIPTNATLDLLVQKYGRTTGLTSGQVTGVNATVRVRYSSGSARFVGQIIIESIGSDPFSAGGDSGSLIVTNDESCNPVGLLFAGSSTVTIANPIDLVLERFVVTVDGGDTPPPPPNDPPTVSITSPADGDTFDSGEPIAFEGTASDTKDDDLILTENIVWTSDIVGQIGTGGSFSAILSDGTHTITASVTDSGGKPGSDSISITVGTPPSGVIYVSSIDMSIKTAGINVNAIAKVTIVDENSVPVAGATVFGNWSGATSDSDVGTTDTLGKITLQSNKIKNAPSGTTFTFTVYDVVKSGWTYDLDSNLEWEDSITVD